VVDRIRRHAHHFRPDPLGATECIPGDILDGLGGITRLVGGGSSDLCGGMTERHSTANRAGVHGESGSSIDTAFLPIESEREE
jgi:hypothetical protein